MAVPRNFGLRPRFAASYLKRSSFGLLVTTRDQELWSRMWSYKDHGKKWEAVYEPNHSPGFRWVHESFGSNGRMLEMQAAIGRIQLRRLAQWTAARQCNAHRIWAAARALPGLRAPELPEHIEHAAYKCYVFVEPGQVRDDWGRDRIMAEINAMRRALFLRFVLRNLPGKGFRRNRLAPRAAPARGPGTW